MESITSHVYRSLQSYWRRRNYRRLEGLPISVTSTNKRIVRLGGGSGSRSRSSRRSWKVGGLKKVLRLRVRIPSPRKLLAQLRDAYMNAMLSLAGGGGMPSAKKGGRGEVVWSKRIPKAREVGLRTGDFEKRMMLHIYNTIMSAPRELTAC